MTTKKPRRFQGRGRILSTALRALMILRAGRWTMFELADELGIEWRTAYRIVGAIRLAGIRVEVSRERAGRQVDAHYRISAAEVRRVLKI